MKTERITVIGAGTMGHGIAQVFATAGFKVNLTDRSSKILASALGRMEASLLRLAEHELIGEADVTATLRRISTVSDLAEAVVQADFIVEAVFENLEVKRGVLREAELFCPRNTVITSTTSSFCARDLAVALEHPDRFLVTHYWNPPTIIPAVEVVPGEATSTKVVTTTMTLLQAVGKRPARINKDVPGFVGNRLQHALRREAIAIVAEGIASAQDVDLIAKQSFGLRTPVVGPLETADLNGLDLTLAIQEYLLPELDRSTQPRPLIREMVERGELGFKTGKGFYEWPPEMAEQYIKQRDEALIEMVKWQKRRQRTTV